MAEAYKIIGALDEFALAREQFGQLIADLQCEETLQWEHGELEAYLSREGTELLRRLLQGHLDLRARREVRREAVHGSDGVLRTHCRNGCERGLMTLFGEVQVRRLGYGARGHGSLYPLDGELNLPGDRYSHGLRRRVSEEVSRSSFDEALERVDCTTGGKVPVGSNIASTVICRGQPPRVIHNGPDCPTGSGTNCRPSRPHGLRPSLREP